jgi:hypothetical protein
MEMNGQLHAPAAIYLARRAGVDACGEDEHRTPIPRPSRPQPVVMPTELPQPQQLRAVSRACNLPCSLVGGDHSEIVTAVGVTHSTSARTAGTAESEGYPSYQMGTGIRKATHPCSAWTFTSTPLTCYKS